MITRHISSRGARLAAVWLLAAGSVPLRCDAGSEASGAVTPPDFSALTLEQLSNVKVTSVARKQQSLSQVAAAVFVITQEEIHRTGFTTVADLLRLVPGFSVARLDGSKWAVTSRGFNGRFATKVLVLIDGRSVYTPIFSGVYWDMAMPLLDDIERIEVIRGPGATMWGANAVNGLVNIITKTAEATRGGVVSVGAGTSERGFAQGRFGGRTGGLGYRGYFSALARTPLQDEHGASARDGWSAEQGGFRLDGQRKNDAWNIEGDLYRNRRSEVGAVPTLEGAGTALEYYNITGETASLAAEWRRRVSERSDLRLNAYYDYTSRPEQLAPVVTVHTANVELQYHFAAGNHHDVSVGMADRYIADNLQQDGLSLFVPGQRSDHLFSTFAQDEIHLLDDRWLLTLGAKLERNYFTGWEDQPTARVIWQPNARHSAWAAVARATRTPTRYERDVMAPLLGIPASPMTGGLPSVIYVQGSTSLRSESMRSYESGYRAQVSATLSADLALFYNHYDGLRGLAYGSPSLAALGQQLVLKIPVAFENCGTGHSEGAELSVAWRPTPSWKLGASYSWLATTSALIPGASTLTVDSGSAGAPRHHVNLQSYLNLSRSVQLDGFFYYASGARTNTFSVDDFYTRPHLRTDIRLGWNVKSSWELSLVGQDLLSHGHLELMAEALTPPSYVSRGVYLRSTWHF